MSGHRESVARKSPARGLAGAGPVAKEHPPRVLSIRDRLILLL